MTRKHATICLARSHPARFTNGSLAPGNSRETRWRKAKWGKGTVYRLLLSAGLVGTVGAIPLTSQAQMPMPAVGQMPIQPFAGTQIKRPPGTTPPIADGTITGGRAYEPPPNVRTPDAPTSTGGARSNPSEICGISDAGLPLTLLAPQQHVGQTSSLRPTVAWFVPDGNYERGMFQIYAKTDASPTGYQPVLENSYEFDAMPGFMTFTLPDDVAALQPGTDYIWQVRLECSSEQNDVHFLRAQMSVVEPFDSTHDSPATDPIAQAEALAAAGLWYDALAIASQAPVAPVAGQFRSELLQRLAELEIASGADSAYVRSLQTIAEDDDSATANHPLEQRPTSRLDASDSSVR